MLKNCGNQIALRTAEDEDYSRLTSLIHFGGHVHRHLDWLGPLDWIRFPPFLVAEVDHQVIGAISCPIDPPGVAWMRLFGVSGEWQPSFVWGYLWPAVLEHLSSLPQISVAVLPQALWFEDLLKSANFSLLTKVVFLVNHFTGKTNKCLAEGYHLRQMNIQDLAQVAAVDRAAFEGLWSNSEMMLTAAYNQSTVSSVIQQSDGQIVGYQISTSGHSGGHLARLAVLPEFQGRGFGEALVLDTLERFAFRNIYRVSVNTQADNNISLKLYTRIGFQFTGESYPVLSYKIPDCQGR